MARVCCENCGGAFTTLTSARAEGCFCNLGCAVRGRVPVDTDGNFPINRHLVAAVAVGFLFFNQLLTAGLSVLAVHRDRVGLSLQLAWVSWGIALLIWLATLGLQHFERVGRGKDHVVSGLVWSILFVAIWKTEPQVGLAAAATGALSVWNFRGILRVRKKG